MKRGCVFGCVGVVLLLILIGGIATLALERLDILREAPVVPLADYALPTPAVQFRAQLDHPEVKALLTDALDQTPAWLIENFTPHEVSFSVDPNLNEGQNALVLALNLKRLGGFLDFAIRDIDEWRFWLNQEVVSAGQEAEGLYVVRSVLPFDPALPERAVTDWTVPQGAPLEFSGDHIMQVQVDNRDGKAFLALIPLLTEEPKEYDAARQALMDVEQLEGFFKRLVTAEATMDLRESGALQADIRIQVPNPPARESLVLFLMLLRDMLFRHLLTQDLVLEGHWTGSGSEITGAFVIEDFRDHALEYIRARAN